MKNFILIVLGMFFISGCEGLPDSGSSFHDVGKCLLTGKVEGDGESIDGAYVAVANQTGSFLASQSTSKEGKYSFMVLLNDDYEIRVKRAGFADYSAVISIEDDFWFSKNINLDLDYGMSDGGYQDGSGDGSEDDSANDYDEAYVVSYLTYLDVELVSCVRSGDRVKLKYILTNSGLSTMGITINNVDKVTLKTFIYDDLENYYDASQVTISFDGKTLGSGNDIDGEIPSGDSVSCVVTVRNVDDYAEYMSYHMYTSIASYGGVNISDDVVLSNVKIH